MEYFGLHLSISCSNEITRKWLIIPLQSMQTGLDHRVGSIFHIYLFTFLCCSVYFHFSIWNDKEVKWLAAQLFSLWTVISCGTANQVIVEWRFLFFFSSVLRSSLTWCFMASYFLATNSNTDTGMRSQSAHRGKRIEMQLSVAIYSICNFQLLFYVHFLPISLLHFFPLRFYRALKK